MKDVRITVRMSEEEHEKLKIIAIKRRKTMNEILLTYVRKTIAKEDENERE